MAYKIIKPQIFVQKIINTAALVHSSSRLRSGVPTYQSNLAVSEGVIKRKLNQLVQWYEETTGMDEVRMAQKRVLDAEERFIMAQDRRRESNKEVAAIQNKLKDLYAELDTTSRGEEKYVTLITEEHKLLKQEKQVIIEFKRYEREEREHFSALSSAVKESHEKERAQAERTKYWSIIGSVVGTVIGIVGSSINNEIRMKELRNLIRESTNNHVTHGMTSTVVPEILTKYEKELNAIASEMNASRKQNDDVVNKLCDVLSVLNNKVKSDGKSASTSVLNSLFEQQAVLEKRLTEMKTILASKPVGEQTDEIQYMYEGKPDQNATVKLLLLSSVVVVFPIVFRYFGLFS